MLVLKLNAGSGLTMTLDNCERVRVKIVRVSGSKVRLGIDAPADVQVTREELLARSGHDGRDEGSSLHDAGTATDGL